MSRARFRMEYVRDGENYSGSIWAQIDPAMSYLCELKLTGVSFAQLLTHLARCVRRVDECEGVALMYLGASNEYAMSPSEIRQLRDDPAAAIRSMREPDRVVIVRDLKKATTPKERELVHPQLRAGHDTLADAFGRYIYFRLRSGRIECPYDGRWKEYTILVSDGSPSVFYEGPTTEEYRSLWFSPRIVNETWARTFTETLLDVGEKKGLSRYYLPRQWNESGPWISHEDLQVKYETFCKERDHVGTGR